MSKNERDDVDHMSMKELQREVRRLRQIDQPQLMYLEQQIAEGLEETRALNNQALESFMSSATSFFDALGEVKVVLGQFKILAVANGGAQTAAAFGACADEILKALSALQRETDEVAKNPFSDVRYAELNELAQYCNAAREAANAYATASDDARKSIQKRIKNAVASATPLIAALYQKPRHSTEELRMVAKMLVDRLNANGKDYDQALRSIRHTDPTTFKQFFPHTFTDDAKAYARKLVSRYNRGEL